MQKKELIILSLSISFIILGVFALASSKTIALTPDEALERLLEGNRRYTEGKMTTCLLTTKERREALSKRQSPYSIILSCSDSRVPPEIIFDKTLGEIFVVRVAGNVLDSIIIGSMEYGVEHLGCPLIVVLGHEKCGAVIASMEDHANPDGNISEIIGAIKPSVIRARQETKGKSHEELVEKVVDYNIQLVAENITNYSPIIKRLVKEGKLKIVKAKYDLHDGKVTLH